LVQQQQQAPVYYQVHWQQPQQAPPPWLAVRQPAPVHCQEQPQRASARWLALQQQERRNSTLSLVQQQQQQQQQPSARSCVNRSSHSQISAPCCRLRLRRIQTPAQQHRLSIQQLCLLSLLQWLCLQSVRSSASTAEGIDVCWPLHCQVQRQQQPSARSCVNGSSQKLVSCCRLRPQSPAHQPDVSMQQLRLPSML
jgi:hypothetical protein